MDFAHSSRVTHLQTQVRRFLDDLVLPTNAQWHRYAATGAYPLDVVEPLKRQAQSLGLWNLFLPGLREHEPGTRLTNLEYAPLAEIMGRVAWSSEVFNCSAPDTGNIELLHRFASKAQTERWLDPLLTGEIRSCFAMSEPDVASSDATNIATRIVQEGDAYVVNGRKWFITGAAHPNCRLAVVMGCSGEASGAQAHARHTLLLVPMDTPGLTLVRNVPVMQQQAIDGHCELLFQDVRVPVANRLGDEGAGFALAQARLGPGRVHHCMRSIGQCELALELMSARALERRAFGRALGDFANVQDWIAHSRIEIDQARLLVFARRLADRHAGRGRGAHRRRRDQARGGSAPDPRARPGDAGLRCDGPDARHPARAIVELGPGDALPRRAGRSALAHHRARRTRARQGRCRVDQPVPAALDAAPPGRPGYLSREASENERLERSATRTAKYKCRSPRRTAV